MSKSLKTIACLKILRGAAAVTIGVSLFLSRRNLGAFPWIDHPELGSIASKDPFLQMIFLWLGGFNSEQILSIAILASVIGVLRWVEAGGIWFNKSWAQWLAVFSGFIYIPFEINELIHRFSWPMLLILLVNTVIVTYLLYALHAKRVAKLSA
jgi:hypothetical protein